MLSFIQNIKHQLAPVLQRMRFDPFAATFSSIKPGSVCIDCGANVGSVTLRMAKRKATVYAFEPNPFAYEALVKAARAYPLVTCLNKAVYLKDSRVKLFFHKQHDENPVMWSTGSSLLKEKSNVNEATFHEVDAVDLSRFIRDLNTPIYILKIDIEGAEYELLDKLIDTDALEKVQHVLVETHAHKVPELKAADEELRKKIKTLGLEDKISLDWI